MVRVFGFAAVAKAAPPLVKVGGVKVTKCTMSQRTWSEPAARTLPIGSINTHTTARPVRLAKTKRSLVIVRFSSLDLAAESPEPSVSIPPVRADQKQERTDY